MKHIVGKRDVESQARRLTGFVVESPRRLSRCQQPSAQAKARRAERTGATGKEVSIQRSVETVDSRKM